MSFEFIFLQQSDIIRILDDLVEWTLLAKIIRDLTDM